MTSKLKLPQALVHRYQQIELEAAKKVKTALGGPASISVRTMSKDHQNQPSSSKAPSVSFEEVQSRLRSGKITLIDVREAEERVDPGRIPGSHHVPLSEFKDAFHGCHEAFEAKYDFVKPLKNDTGMTLHCRTGRRSRLAAGELADLDYSGFSVYDGGFTDWQEKGGHVLAGIEAHLADFEAVQKGLADASITLIDVRRLMERFHPGRIPGSRHIPLSEIFTSFQLSPEEFLFANGFPKPEPSVEKSQPELVLHCLKGKRAQDAADKLAFLGYPTTVYLGSFSDWMDRGGAVETYMTYPEARSLLEQNKIVLIDVRSTEELEREGHISGSKHIPLSDLEEAFMMDEGRFLKTFGFQKPNQAPSAALTVTLSSHTGKKAEEASLTLKAMGIRATFCEGSLDEWFKAD
eukprot:maker-scaffold821_size92673-snap-gene-0.15 protein:Tk12551 transcript:maker-scaffold821_size92673-snap-gene-0.15-mRNA-1 annotation:"hypothetical protein DAPPUDRAFT_92990"